MPRCGVGLTDLFGTATVTSSGHLSGSTLVTTNVQTDLPSESYQQWEGQDSGGSFEVTSGVDDLVYVNEGGGAVATTIAAGWYSTAAALATEITTKLNANGSLSFTYACSYSTSTRKFTLSAGSAFAVPNSSSPTRNLLTILLGWDATNLSGTTSYTADSERSSTLTYLYFAMGSGNGIAPSLIALMLESVGGTDTAAATLYNDVTVYAAASYLGNNEAAWAASAPLSLNVSDRPSEAENTLQAAVTSNATTYEHWFIAWTHVDDCEYHRIQICRAVEMLSSSSRTSREVGEHHLRNRTRTFSLENQHPVQLLSDWHITIELERWEEDDYRAFKIATDRYGPGKGLIYAQNWSSILSGSLAVDDEADKGLIFYGALEASTPDGYGAKGSQYMSGQMAFGQVRP